MSGGARVAALAAVLAAVLLASTACRLSPAARPGRSPSAPSVSPSTAATVVLLVNPFAGGQPAPGIQVTQSTSGTCQSSNVDTGNASALRCFLDQPAAEGGTIADPCFAGPADGTGTLLCLQAPEATTALQVTPDGPVDTPATPLPNALPWYVELSNGQRCGMIGGATGLVNGMRLNYGCHDGNAFGDPDRSSPVWTIAYQPTGSRTVSTVPITKVWS